MRFVHAVVCVKQVPDTAEVRIDPETNTLIREGVPSIINPYDAHAVEAAVQLKEMVGGKVTVISMGPPQAAEVLRKAISMGADDAILVSDRAFAGSDTLATSYILAQAIRKVAEKEPVDIVLCGKQAIDGDTAQVGPGIAVRLGYNQLTYVMKIDSLDMEKKEIKIRRKLEGQTEVALAKLPAMITVVKDINDLRYAAFPDMLKAATAQVKMWGKNDFDLEDEQLGLKGSPTTVRKIFPPPEKPGGRMIPGADKDPQKASAELVDILLKTIIIADK